MNLTALIDLYHHMEWADACVWRTLLATEKAQADLKLRDYFYHLHMVQRAFLRVWRGEPRETPFPKFDNTEELARWGASYYPEAFAYLESLTEPQLATPFAMPWASMVEAQIGRAPDVATAAETILQVALHSLYHRGQVNARLREVGGEPPLVDFIAWVWSGRPAAVWPFAL